MENATGLHTQTLKAEINESEYGCMDCGYLSPCPVKSCEECGSAEMVPTATCAVPPADPKIHKLRNNRGWLLIYDVWPGFVILTREWNGHLSGKSLKMSKEEARANYGRMLKDGFKKTK
jgi:hypothetical protein